MSLPRPFGPGHQAAPRRGPSLLACSTHTGLCVVLISSFPSIPAFLTRGFLPVLFQISASPSFTWLIPSHLSILGSGLTFSGMPFSKPAQVRFFSWVHLLNETKKQTFFVTLLDARKHASNGNQNDPSPGRYAK